MTRVLSTARRSATTLWVAVSGIALTAAVGGWALASRALNGFGAVGEAVLYCAVVGSFFLGAGLALWAHRWLAPLAVGGAGLVLVWILAAGGLQYANANAALAVQTAALVAVASFRTGLRRGVAAVVVLPLLSLTLVADSRAGALTGALVLLAVLSPSPPDYWLRRLALGAGTLFAGLVALQGIVVGRGLRPAGLVRALSESRFELWSEALALIAQRPVVGHGPGAFSLISPTAQSNPLLRPSHSAPLEVASDLGLVGLGLLALVVAAGYLAIAAAPSSASLVAVAAWTGLWSHSLVDYPVDYPLIMLVAGLVVGAALGEACSADARTMGNSRTKTPHQLHSRSS